MEPVTHILTGACLARTGFNRRAAYATATMAIAAEFPDIDTLWGLRGPVASFQHHRGITHSFVGLPVEAALIVGAVYLVHRWRVAQHSKKASGKDAGLRLPSASLAAPVRWGVLYLLSLLALLTHLLLDYTNNYGIRPFLPFSGRWYAASITFIFDPLMFVLLLAALLLPPMFRLVGAEVGSRREPFTAPGWAIAALFGVVSLWVFREVEHNHALNLAMAQSVAAPRDPESPDAAPEYLQPQRVLANPDPFSPFRWWTVTDFGPLYELGQANTKTQAFYPGQQPEFKVRSSPAMAAAVSSRVGKAYLDWSPMPFVRVTQQGTPEGAGLDLAPGHTLVTFQDPRFMGDFPFMRSRTPLQATVELDQGNRVMRETMNGKEQH